LSRSIAKQKPEVVTQPRQYEYPEGYADNPAALAEQNEEAEDQYDEDYSEDDNDDIDFNSVDAQHDEGQHEEDDLPDISEGEEEEAPLEEEVMPREEENVRSIFEEMIENSATVIDILPRLREEQIETESMSVPLSRLNSSASVISMEAEVPEVDGPSKGKKGKASNGKKGASPNRKAAKQKKRQSLDSFMNNSQGGNSLDLLMAWCSQVSQQNQEDCDSIGLR